MLLCICVGVLACVESPSKQGKLHEGLDYIVYLRYSIEFDCITVILKVKTIV